MPENGNGKRTRTATDRRTLLKGVSGISGGLVLGTVGADVVEADAACELPDGSGNYSEGNYEWRKEDTDYVEGRWRKGPYSIPKTKLEIRSSLVYRGAEYNDDPDGSYWEHFFLSGAFLNTKISGGEPDGNIDNHSLTIENRDTSAADIWAPWGSQNDAIGATPPEPDANPAGENFADAAFTVFLGAIASTNPYIGATITAAQATYALVDSPDITSANTKTWEYGYEGTDFCEAIHYSYFTMRCEQGHSEAGVTVRNEAEQYHGSGTVSKEWNVYVDAVPDGIETTAKTDRQLVGTDEYTSFLESSDQFVEISEEESYSRSEKSDETTIYRARDPLVRLE